MGKKIKVVDIVKEETVNEQPTPETDEVVAVVEPEQVIVNDTPPHNDVETNVETVKSELEVTPQKPKAKTTSRSKKKQTVDVVEVPTEVEAGKVEETPASESKEKVKKVIEQVKCPKCDKMMSQKSLRYTHEQNCKGKVAKTEDLPVKRRCKQPDTEKKETPEVTTNKKEVYNKIVSRNVNIETNEVNIPDDLKHEVLKTILKAQQRIKMKEDNLNRLKMQIV